MRPSQRFIQYSRTIRSRLFNHGNGFVGTSRRRWQSSDAQGAAKAEAVRRGGFARVWNSPVGIKTVHFWAPVMKWALVLAGVSDFYRPADKLSLTQNLALTATGIIWTRWCFIIRPKNILLATVNFFLACVGTIQVSRIFAFRRSQPITSNTVDTSTTTSNSPSTSSSAVVNEIVAIKDEVVKDAKDATAKVKDVAKKLI